MPASESTVNIASADEHAGSPFGHALPAARQIPTRLGAYEILRPIGKGGMARVLLAEHTAMRRQVALKVLPDEAVLNSATLERFYREARAAAALDHPNIVRAFDVREADGFHFLVMEYVPGEDLEVILQKRGPLPPAEAVGFALQAAAGLRHAHKQGLIHRDIKPANLLLDRNGVIKILDLGLARFHKDGDRLTAELDGGAIMCTPDYVAPEQLDPEKVVDHRVDIYSLGGTLFALLTGRAPFEGTTPQKLVAHQARNPVPANQLRPEIPPELSAVVSRMLAKDPAVRYQTASEVIRALRTWQDPTSPNNPLFDSISVLMPATETGRQGRTIPAPDWREITSNPDTDLNAIVRENETFKRRTSRSVLIWQAVLGGVIVLIVAGLAFGMNWLVRRIGKSAADAGPEVRVALVYHK